MPISPGELRTNVTPTVTAAPVDAAPRAVGPVQQRAITVSTSDNRVATFVDNLRRFTGQATALGVELDRTAGFQAEQEANMKALAADPKTLREEIASGNYFGQAHRRARLSLEVMDAQNRAFEVGQQLDGMNQRGELAGANATELLKATLAPHMDAISQPLAKRQFTRSIQPVMTKLQQQVQQQTIQREEDNKGAAFFGYLERSHADLSKSAADTPEEERTRLLRQNMFRAADYARNSLMMSEPQIERQFIEMAKQMAARGDRVGLAAVGEFDRGGARIRERLGAQWETLTATAKAEADKAQKKTVNTSVDDLEARAIRGEGTVQEFGAAVDAMRAKDPENFQASRAERLKQAHAAAIKSRTDAANRQLAEQQQESVDRQIVEQGAEFLRNGRAYALPEEVRFKDATGKVHTLTRKAYEDRMYQHAEAQIARQAQENGWTPEQASQAILRLHGQNGSVPTLYRNVFADLTMGARAGIPPNPEQLAEKLGHLEMVRKTDVGQFLNLGRGGDRSSAVWLNAYRAARDFDMSPEQAYAVASQRAFKPDANERLTASEREAQLEAVVKRFSGSAGVLAGQIARQKASDAIDILVAAGTPANRLTERALEALNRSHVVANGIPVTNGLPGVPDPRVATEYLADAAKFFKQSNPKLANQTFNIAIADNPSRPGEFVVIRTDTFERLSNASITGDRLKQFVLEWRGKTADENKARRDDAMRFPSFIMP